MKFQRYTNLLATRYFMTSLVAVLGIATFPSTSRADMSVFLGFCQQAGGECDQTINAAGTNSGTTVNGDTNPPPVYNVTATSNGVLILHWSGSTIDTGVGGPGFTTITFMPQATYGWSAFDFTIDSLNASQAMQPPGTSLQFVLTDQLGNVTTINEPFPWEGNNGENQQYTALAKNGEFITKLQLIYTAPSPGTNTIQDIHNIDVHTGLVQGVVVPEPSAFLLLGMGLISMAGFIRRKHT